MNSALVQSVLLHLARLGVREICVAAGARNTPLIAGVLASRGVRVWHFFEERCAAFFALGRMMVDERPVAVITTSGTAAAELLPAVIEAHYQGRPLVLVTADRPARFRGSGAPQAIEQPGIFGRYATRTLDIDAAKQDIAWPQEPGRMPIHINVCLEEATAIKAQGVDFSVWENSENSETSVSDDQQEVFSEFIAERSGLAVLVAGLSPQQAAALAQPLAELGAPIVAEATANLHRHPELHPLIVRGGELALRALNPLRVLRIGAVPSWRWWRDLEDRSSVHVLHFGDAPYPGLARHQGVAVQSLEVITRARIAPSPLAQVDLHLAAVLDDLVQAHPLSEPAWMHHLSTVAPEGARVFLGNSLPIREWNLTAGHVHETYASRGANGIDGIVSTFYGTAHGMPESWLIIGDLSALYDLAGPWIARQMEPGRRRIVVINNGGGKIFSRVDSLRQLDDGSRSIIENRHDHHFKAWADLWRMGYREARTPGDLENLVGNDLLIEVLPDAAQTDAFWSAWTKC